MTAQNNSRTSLIVTIYPLPIATINLFIDGISVEKIGTGSKLVKLCYHGTEKQLHTRAFRGVHDRPAHGKPRDAVPGLGADLPPVVSMMKAITSNMWRTTEKLEKQACILGKINNKNVEKLNPVRVSSAVPHALVTNVSYATSHKESETLVLVDHEIAPRDVLVVE